MRHTVALPTDAYGCIDFRGTRTNKAQYLRLAYDTKPDRVLNLLLRGWCLDKPKLLITVTGGKANFDLQPRIKWCLRKGLLKAAKTTGAWLLTGMDTNSILLCFPSLLLLCCTFLLIFCGILSHFSFDFEIPTKGKSFFFSLLDL